MKTLFLLIVILLLATVANAQITFTWDPSTTNTSGVADTMSYYTIYNNTTGTPVLFSPAQIPLSDCTASLCTWTGGTTPTVPSTFYCTVTDTSGNTSGPSNTATYNPIPGVITNAATAITSTTATLNGTVNPNRLATTAYFQWGTSTSYGNTTSTQSIGSGTANVNVTAAIAGLTAGTTYYFRIVATNSTGTADGATASFAAAAAIPPSPPGGFMWK